MLFDKNTGLGNVNVVASEASVDVVMSEEATAT